MVDTKRETLADTAPVATDLSVTPKVTPQKNVEGIVPNDGWKSRKFLMAFFTAISTLVAAYVGHWQGKISEDAFLHVFDTDVLLVSVFCGFNVLEKFGAIAGLIFGKKEKTP